MDGTKWFVLITVVTTIGLIGLLTWLGTNSQSIQPGEQLSDDQWQQLIADAPHVLGPDDAAVTIVEFGDFQCPACQVASTPLKRFLESRDDIRLIWRHFPLSQHAQARAAARAAEAAAEHGEFFSMVEQLFRHQREWGSGSNQREQFATYAEAIGIDRAAFTESYEQVSSEPISRDLNLGATVGVSSTPTFYANRVYIQGTPQSDHEWQQVIESILADQGQEQQGDQPDPAGTEPTEQ